MPADIEAKAEWLPHSWVRWRQGLRSPSTCLFMNVPHPVQDSIQQNKRKALTGRSKTMLKVEEKSKQFVKIERERSTLNDGVILKAHLCSSIFMYFLKARPGVNSIAEIP